MKRIISLSFICCFLFVGLGFALQIQNIYSTTAPLNTSITTSTTTCVSQINKPSVRIKQIMISNGATAQTVSLYKVPVSHSTSTVTNVANIDVPASSVVFFPSTLANDENNFDIPYFAVATSTTTNPAKVNVIYKD